MEWTGSPTKKTNGASFTIFDENESCQPILKRTASAFPLALATSKLVNEARNGSFAKVDSPVRELLAKLTTPQDHATFQKCGVQEDDYHSSSSSATDPYANTPPTEAAASDGRPDAAEVYRLKKELEMAQERLAHMDLQLTQSRMAQHTMEQAIGSPFPGAGQLAASIPAQSTAPAGTTHPFDSFASAGSQSRYDRSDFSVPQSSIDLGVNFPRPASGLGIRHGFNPPITPFRPPWMANSGAVQQAPIGTRLSPTANEFGTGSGKWIAEPQQPQRQPASPSTLPSTYVATAEPLNYRRLLDRNTSCNWKYIVDKIVCNNDQQASIFLQQKLKVGTPEQKFEIVQSIINQAYPLMINRFGNFLIQRCFEHGTSEQIISIAKSIRGNTLNLSMDAFGCHVVQKAFDCVPEEYKAIMVHELLRRIPETVIHRYACHVWQKLFELRWSDSPPQIMKFVNEALRGMWHEVALGETGSLVVQNIFENCLEEDKRPCINEVLASIDVVSHGQFGNWCIQHICEHGAVPDRTRAIDHVLRYATEYSTDQFASKVVEKCLKIGGTDFLDRYLERVCEGRPDRPRMPLIDIAGDQFGNYLIQYILSNGDPSRREIMAAHIRKHMVSLRGSKYGSRVAMLCSNPASATRPGPPTGLPSVAARNGFAGDRERDRFGPEYVRTHQPERLSGNRNHYSGHFR